MSFFVRLFPSLPVLLPIFWGLSHGHQPQLVSPSSSRSIVFKFSCQVQVLIYLFTFSYFHSVVCQDGKIHYSTICHFVLFCWLSQGLVVWPRFGDSFASQNPWKLRTSHSLGQILGRAYTISADGQIKKKMCTVPSGSPSLSIHVYLYIFCANILHLLIMRLTNLSLSPDNMPFLFCCTLSIFALPLFILVVLFWAAI